MELFGDLAEAMEKLVNEDPHVFKSAKPQLRASIHFGSANSENVSFVNEEREGVEMVSGCVVHPITQV